MSPYLYAYRFFMYVRFLVKPVRCRRLMLQVERWTKHNVKDLPCGSDICAVLGS